MAEEEAAASQYQVLEELGSGSFGVVYKAIERSTGDIVAIKHVRNLQRQDGKSLTIYRSISNPAKMIYRRSNKRYRCSAHVLVRS